MCCNDSGLKITEAGDAAHCTQKLFGKHISLRYMLTHAGVCDSNRL